MKNMSRFKRNIKNETTVGLKRKISAYESELRSNMERIMEITEEKNHRRINAADLKYFDMLEELEACKEELSERIQNEEKTL